MILVELGIDVKRRANFFLISMMSPVMFFKKIVKIPGIIFLFFEYFEDQAGEGKQSESADAQQRHGQAFIFGDFHVFRAIRSYFDISDRNSPGMNGETQSTSR
jgi:hypothetical protein